MNFTRQICEDFSIVFLPGIHTLILHRSQDAYNYIWKIFPGIGYGTRNSSEVMPARKRGQCRLQTRFHSASLAAVLSSHPRSCSLWLATTAAARLRAKDRRLLKVCNWHCPRFLSIARFLWEFRCGWKYRKVRQHQLLSKKRTILKRQTENRLPPFISECHTQHPFRSKEIVSLDLPPKFHPSELQFRLHNFCRHIIPALL